MQVFATFYFILLHAAFVLFLMCERLLDFTVVTIKTTAFMHDDFQRSGNRFIPTVLVVLVEQLVCCICPFVSQDNTV